MEYRHPLTCRRAAPVTCGFAQAWHSDGRESGLSRSVLQSLRGRYEASQPASRITNKVAGTGRRFALFSSIQVTLQTLAVVTSFAAIGLAGCGGGDAQSTSPVAHKSGTPAVTTVRIAPAKATFSGQTYAQWAAAFWQWAFGSPVNFSSNVRIPLLIAMRGPYPRTKPETIGSGLRQPSWRRAINPIRSLRPARRYFLPC